MASQTLRSLAGRAKLAFTDAAPVILFFLIAFYSILWLFGVKYIIVVSVLATLFKVRCRKRQTMAKLLSMAAVQLSLAVLAFLAGHWLILCVILNILVPFLLVFLQSTQFNQKGYFTSAMGFVFFQLNPVAVSEFGRFLCAMTYGLLLLAGALLIYSRGRERDVDYGLERRGLEVLAGHLSAWAAGEENAEAGSCSPSSARSANRWNRAGDSYAVKREGQIHYMAALLFQRSAYFLTVLRENGIGEEEKRFLLRLCAFLREFNRCWPGTGTKAGADGEENYSRALRENGEELAREAGLREDGIGRFGEQTVSLLLTLLSRLEQRDLPLAAVRRRSGEKGRPLAWILQRFRPDTFEMRFSLRLSSVLTLGFLFSRLSGCQSRLLVCAQRISFAAAHVRGQRLPPEKPLYRHCGGLHAVVFCAAAVSRGPGAFRLPP